ncbi:MAG: TerB N-terminal domain-containing protein [Sedimentisphaerales bacterium]
MKENTVKRIMLLLFAACFALLTILFSFGISFFLTIFIMLTTSIVFLVHKYQITFFKKILLTVLFLLCCTLGYDKGSQVFFQSFVVLGVIGILVWVLIKDPYKKLATKSESSFVSKGSKIEVFKKLVKKPEPYFLGKGSKIEIAGHILEDPLIYVVDSKTYEDFDASLLCLRREIGVPYETTQRTLPYWPCLSNTDSTQVANYIKWLATGKKDTDIELGYVFIYFYGLERRALLDQKDILDVGYEVIRLLGIYGKSGSFRQYATGLLIHLILLGILIPKNKLINAIIDYQEGHLSEAFQIMLLGYLAKDNKPLPVNWALRLAKQDERVIKSVVLNRAYEEFQKLFTIRYNEKYANKLIPQKREQNLRIDYHAASPTLLSGAGFESTIPSADWPSIIGWKKQFAPVVELFNECIEELKAFSRKASMLSEDKSIAFITLPSDLQQELGHPQQKEWDLLLANYADDTSVLTVPIEKIAGLRKIAAKPKLTLVQSAMIAQYVESFGSSIEPDPRYTKRPFQWNDHCAILNLPDKPYLPEGQNYSLVSLIMPLALEVAVASGMFEDKERLIIIEFFQERFLLTRNDRIRLEASIIVHLTNGISLLRIKDKIQSIFEENQRKSIGKFLVMIAGAVAEVCSEEIEALERTFKFLGLRIELVKEYIKELGYAAPELSRLLVKGIKEPQGEVIPSKVTVLDIDKIRKIHDDSIEASKLLIQAMDISATEELNKNLITNQKEKSELQDNSIHNLVALISNHIKPFFEEVITKKEWLNYEINTLARKHNVTVSAALEEINTWSDEHLGDFLIEEGDNIVINIELLDKFGDKR